MSSEHPLASRASFSLQAAITGLVAAFVGFASAFAVVLQGLTAVGATERQAAAGLLALSIGMGVCAIWLSQREKVPVSIAWSTPGAALLATTGEPVGGFAVAVGAFCVCGLLLVLAGWFRPLNDAVTRIPAHLANAMLAGVLIGLCLAPFQAIAAFPAYGVAILSAWTVGVLWRRIWAVPLALLAFVVIVFVDSDARGQMLAQVTAAAAPPVIFVVPEFSVSAVLGIALPLFLVTMAGQNIPGAAVVASFGYPTRPGPWVATSGIFSTLTAPFGGHALNLAAITAAICAGEDAHADPSRRYWAATFMGIGSIVLGLLSGVAIAFVALAPPLLIQAVAGLALIGAFTGSAVAAFKDAEHRESAAITFLFAASGASFLGISGAFWGLLAGAALHLAKNRLTRR